MEAGLFPFLEANQGLLSLLALGAALAFAVWEHIRAEMAQVAQFNRLVESARSFAQVTDKALAWAIQNPDQFTGQVAHSKEIQAYSDALRAAAPGAPSEVAIFLVRLGKTLDDAAVALAHRPSGPDAFKVRREAILQILSLYDFMDWEQRRLKNPFIRFKEWRRRRLDAKHAGP